MDLTDKLRITFWKETNKTGSMSLCSVQIKFLNEALLFP